MEFQTGSISWAISICYKLNLDNFDFKSAHDIYQNECNMFITQYLSMNAIGIIRLRALDEMNSV